MLAITALIPLLLTAAVSASPFTTVSGRPAYSSSSNSTMTTAAAPESRTLITPTAVALATGAANPPPLAPPAQKGPRPTQPPRPLPEFRVDEAGFAVSSAAAAAKTASPEGDDGNIGAGATQAVAAAAAAAAVTTDAPPADVPEADSDLARQGYSQTTYYACETFARATHCGWHVPVVQVGAAAAPERSRGRSVGVAAAGAAACGMLVSWALNR